MKRLPMPPALTGGLMAPWVPPEGLASLDDLKAEIDEMTGVLLGRQKPPVDMGWATLYEVSTVYYSRAMEIQLYLLRGEQEGKLLKNSPPYRFRTGELRTFIDLAKAKMDLGSRRITVLQMDPEIAVRFYGGS